MVFNIHIKRLYVFK